MANTYTLNVNSNIADFETQFNSGQLTTSVYFPTPGQNTHVPFYKKGFGIYNSAMGLWEASSPYEPPRCLGLRDDMSGTRPLRGPVFSGTHINDVKGQFGLVDQLEVSLHRNQALRLHADINLSLFGNLATNYSYGAAGVATVWGILVCGVVTTEPGDLCNQWVRFDASNWTGNTVSFDLTLSANSVNSVIEHEQGIGLWVETFTSEYIQFLGATATLTFV